MSTGGFKLVKFQWNGGRADSEEDRVKFVLKGVAQAIIESNTGWILDTDWNATTDNPKQLKNYVYNTTTYGYNYMLFLKNGNGMKLAIGYASKAAYLKYDTDGAIKGYVAQDSSYPSGQSPCGYLNGLYFSFIPSYSSSDDWIEDLDYGITLPQSAARFFGFGYTNSITYPSESSRTSAVRYSFVTENAQLTTYQIFFLLKNDENFLTIFERKSSWDPGKYKGFLFGELIKSFAHTSDTKSMVVFPLFNFNESPLKNKGYTSSFQPSDASEYASPSTSTTNSNDSYCNFGIMNQETSFLTTTYQRLNLNQIQNASGDVFFSYRNASSLVTGWASPVFVVSNSNQLTVGVVSDPNLSSGGRWCPFYSYIYSSDPTTLGVVENDGLKGYLDTDVLRAVTVGRYSQGATFGINSEFIYIGGGIALGWDSSNTETLF